MPTAKEIFERQYGEGRLQYRQRLRWLRRQLRPLIRDRIRVTVDVVTRLCADGRSRRVLDFGCGDGQLAIALAKRCPAGLQEVVGIDLSESRVVRARRAATGISSLSLRFLSGDVGEVAAVKGEGFHIITCLAVFGQVYDVYGVGGLLAETLTPSGVLLAEYANYAYIRRRLQMFGGVVPTISPASMDSWPEIGWDSGEVHYFSRATALRFTRQLGLMPRAVHTTGLLATLLPFWSSLLATGFVIEAVRPE